jgi:hypothetical protein
MRTFCAIQFFGIFLASLVCGPAYAGDDIAKLLDNGQSLPLSTLAEQRGGSSQPVETSEIANVTGNTIGSHTITGSNSFGSFGNAQGLMTVFQNTGNNVSMQSQTVLNVNLQ